MENLEIELQILEDAKTISDTLPDPFRDLFLLLLEAEVRRVKSRMAQKHGATVIIPESSYHFNN